MPAMTDEIRSMVKAQLVAKPKPKIKPNVHVLVKSEKRKGAGLWCRPFETDALSCNADQAEEYRQILRSHGITAEIDSEGNCHVTSEKQFRDVAKARGLFTGRDGYGAEGEGGHRIMTGREQAQGQARLRRLVEKYEREYE